MKKVLITVLSLCLTTGCVPLMIGAGVAAGYTLSGDSATGNIDSEYRVLWDLCLEKLESMEAEILVANESKGVIKAKVSENDVVVSINTINSETQRLKVSARRFFMPKPQFAQKVFFKILQDL